MCYIICILGDVQDGCGWYSERRKQRAASCSKRDGNIVSVSPAALGLGSVPAELAGVRRGPRANPRSSDGIRKGGSDHDIT